jgi:hypothetical protein
MKNVKTYRVDVVEAIDSDTDAEVELGGEIDLCSRHLARVLRFIERGTAAPGKTQESTDAGPEPKT